MSVSKLRVMVKEERSLGAVVVCGVARADVTEQLDNNNKHGYLLLGLLGFFYVLGKLVDNIRLRISFFLSCQAV